MNQTRTIPTELSPVFLEIAHEKRQKLLEELARIDAAIASLGGSTAQLNGSSTPATWTPKTGSAGGWTERAYQLIMSKPYGPFTAKDLSAWLRDAYGPEMAKIHHDPVPSILFRNAEKWHLERKKLKGNRVAWLKPKATPA